MPSSAHPDHAGPLTPSWFDFHTDSTGAQWQSGGTVLHNSVDLEGRAG
jgi:hypothetical protein